MHTPARDAPRAAVRLRRDARRLRRRAHGAVARARRRPRPRAARPAARRGVRAGRRHRRGLPRRTTTRRRPSRSPGVDELLARLDRWGLASNKERGVRAAASSSGSAGRPRWRCSPTTSAAQEKQLGPLLDALGLDADEVVFVGDTAPRPRLRGRGRRPVRAGGLEPAGPRRRRAGRPRPRRSPPTCSICSDGD